MRDCGRMFGGRYGAELIALFSRCYTTLSVPCLVDHVRRFGQFSKPWLAAQIERSTQPRLFDFVRYQDFGGVKPLPMIVTKPYALESYARMLNTCSAKRYMFDQLEAQGLVPARALSMKGMLSFFWFLHIFKRFLTRSISFLSKFLILFLGHLNLMKLYPLERGQASSCPQRWQRPPSRTFQVNPGNITNGQEISRKD